MDVVKPATTPDIKTATAIPDLKQLYADMAAEQVQIDKRASENLQRIIQEQEEQRAANNSMRCRKFRSFIRPFPPFSMEWDKTPCWLWIGATDKRGDGLIQVGGRQYRAHRVSWEIFRGSIPAGRIVWHNAGCPVQCVNPRHLLMGSHAERRMYLREQAPENAN